MRRRGVVAAAVLVALVVVGAVFVLRHGGRSAAPRGVVIDHSFTGVKTLSVPGELDGIGALKLKAPRGVKGWTVISWRFGRVRPAVAVRYLVRPFPTPPGDRCPGAHGGYDGDAVAARATGDRYPCGGFRSANGVAVSGDRWWELVAVFRAPPRGGAVVSFAEPVVTLRGPSGRVATVRAADFDQATCVIGGARCVRFLARGSFTTAQARTKVRLICHVPRRPPLFVTAAFRPPFEPRTERGRDDRGRVCTAAS